MRLGITKLEAERAEFEAVLASELFGRPTNVVRFLSYVCERYFEDAIHEIKEYSIAVHALGRPESFDPQTDPIVRVTAHALRKRLEVYYQTVGADRPVHIGLPSGHYVPKFVHRGEAELPQGMTQQGEAPENQCAPGVPSPCDMLPPVQTQVQTILSPGPNGSRNNDHSVHPGNAETKKPDPWRRLATVKTIALLVLIACAFLALPGRFHGRRGDIKPLVETQTAPAAMAVSAATLRALAGDQRGPYTDSAGSTWLMDRFCSGGNSFSASHRVVRGTREQQLFTAGRLGSFRCKYPVPPGIYEVHLLFAETAGLQENGRYVAYSINRGSPTSIDIVDEAEGDDTATQKIYTDIQPGNDGTIHIDFLTSDSFVNAVEILPGLPHHMLPVRLVVGDSPQRDSNGNLWSPDQGFFGGRISSPARDISKISDSSLYKWHRFGHFHYVVPVATGSRYKLKLYFQEPWFGHANGNIGGAGSRVFDVSCNGAVLLKQFDIFSEAGSEPLVKSFSHIEPTAQGKIEIYFTPRVNYPALSAIEVSAE
jgi:hypothetical protein